MIRPIALLALAASLSSSANAQAVYAIDAAGAPAAPASGYLKLGTSSGPAGEIGVNSRYLTKDGRPWFPVMGEFHFSRYPETEWGTELAKMKAQGIDIVSSYVIWNEIELRPGVLDWSGARDLRRFVELCRENGLLFYLRPGPWAHAETRFGGIPDWVQARGRTRSDDPVYLQAVRAFWAGMAAQLRGLLWKDGGPVIGMQVENEYNIVGPGRGADHITTLLNMARDLQLDVPLYTVTGWDRAVYPRGLVAPVVGGYPDEPWATSMSKLPPKENYLFRFDSRVSGDLGAQTVNASTGPADADLDRDLTPFLGAEYGPGIPTMYRRRPIIAPQDIQAQMITQLGSGLNLLGYYMFHGGANPLAEGRGLEETTRSGSFNDVPVIGYDFQAPLGQYGERRPVADVLRPLHLFLNTFGDRLAPMSVRKPPQVPKDATDTSVIRYAVRSDGYRGFLFVNNHIRQYPMPERQEARFDVSIGGETLHLPARSIPDGASFVWPLNMDLGGVNLAWASAQPVTMLADGKTPVFVFIASPKIPASFAFPQGTSVSAPSRLQDGKRVVDLHADAGRFVSVRDDAGHEARILLIDEADAHRLWKGSFGGRPVLMLTEADVRFDRERIVLTSASPMIRAKLFPSVAVAKTPAQQVGVAGPFTTVAFRLKSRATRMLAVEQVRAPGKAPPIALGGPAKAAVQPSPDDYAVSGAWTFTVPSDAISERRNWLHIDYRGDVGRLFDGDRMLDDRFWDGRRWDVAVDRFSDRIGRPWLLTVMPLRADAPIYLDESVKPQIGEHGQISEVRAVRLVPEYEVQVLAAPSFRPSSSAAALSR